jgi:hypothetical protein
VAGQIRVFLISPESVGRENPAYSTFVRNQVRLLGRQHPLIKSEYFNEPIEAAAGLFPPRRRALMLGRHPRRYEPVADQVYLALIDIGGQDETPTDQFGLLQNPSRDYTVCTIAHVDNSVAQPAGPESSDRGEDSTAIGPTYYVQDVFVDHGSRHFQTLFGQPPLMDRLVAYLRHWRVSAIVVDATGVGQGIADALIQTFPPATVISFNFAQNHNKARLGNDFLALIETGRFKYFSEREQGSRGAGERRSRGAGVQGSKGAGERRSGGAGEQGGRGGREQEERQSGLTPAPPHPCSPAPPLPCSNRGERCLVVLYPMPEVCL